MAPDGKRLAIIRAMGGRDRLEFPVGNVLYQSDGFMIVPRVAPNGGRVAFLERVDGQESVVIVSAAGEKRIVAAGQNTTTGLALSAYGRDLVFTVVKNGSTTLRAAASSGDPRVITRMAGEWRLHDISREGRILLSQDHKRSYVMSGTTGDEIERDCRGTIGPSPSICRTMRVRYCSPRSAQRRAKRKRSIFAKWMAHLPSGWAMGKGGRCRRMAAG